MPGSKLPSDPPLFLDRFVDRLGRLTFVDHVDGRGRVPPSERRVLAVDAFAQARSMLARASGRADANAREVVFTASGSALTRGRLRLAVQAALSSAEPRGDEHEQAPEWRTMSYTPEQTEPTGAAEEDALQQLPEFHSSRDTFFKIRLFASHCFLYLPFGHKRLFSLGLHVTHGYVQCRDVIFAVKIREQRLHIFLT